MLPKPVVPLTSLFTVKDIVVEEVALSVAIVMLDSGLGYTACDFKINR